MSLVVKKFGGTSVADIDNIKNVASIIKNAVSAGDRVVAVVSAMAGVTNDLISKCFSVSDLTTSQQIREYDASVSSGEIVTASLLALQLDSIGIKAKSLQGWQVPMITNHDVGDALIEEIPTDKINFLLDQGYTPVITGFQGVANNDVTTLGKGGSDTTAALLAAALKADRCDIYTDVDGIFSADPSVVNTAHRIDKIGSNLMLRLSDLGAKVLHPRAAQAAVRYNLNVRIVSSFNKSKSSKSRGNLNGTRIEQERYVEMEGVIVKAITGDRNILIIKLILPKSARYDEILESIHQIGLDYQSFEISNDTDAHFITLHTKLTDKNKYNQHLLQLQNQQLITNYHYNADIATVSLVGYGINNKTVKTRDSDLVYLKGKVMKILSDNNISFYSMTCCSTDMTLIIDDRNFGKAQKALHTLVENQ